VLRRMSDTSMVEEAARVIVTHDDLRSVARLAAQSPTLSFFLDALGRHLSGSPLCVERIFVSLQTLHPAFRARTYLWKKQSTEIHIVEWPHGLENRPGYYDSPDHHVHSSRAEFRIRNLQEVAGHSCELYGKLRDEGYTDYLMVPLVFIGGTVNTLAIATKRPSGFPEEELVRFRGLTDVLAIAVERYAALETVAITLRTYLGHGASREVVRGRIRAGRGELIQAGILLADMHGFTGHATRLGPSGTVQLLNDYFDCIVGAIEEKGGYILKFIGDAVLAYFPIAADRPDPDPIAAVHAIRSGLAELNRTRHARGEPLLHHGVGLHFGDVVFGNVGSRARLDFTIIGDAVNLAARCADKTRDLDFDYVATAEFVARFGIDGFVSIGPRELRGFARPIVLFGLAGEADSSLAPTAA